MSIQLSTIDVRTACEADQMGPGDEEEPCRGHSGSVTRRVLVGAISAICCSFITLRKNVNKDNFRAPKWINQA